MNVLYLSYNGALEPLGPNQIVVYPLMLAREGFKFTLITFEKARDLNDRARVQAMHTRLLEHDVVWYPLAYHKRPAILSTFRDVIQGYMLVNRLARRQHYDIVHIRSYIPLLFGLQLRRAKSRFIFDMRGFWADERVDWGNCRHNSLQYRMIKALEQQGLQHADIAVVLSERAKQYLQKHPTVQQRRLPIATVVCYTDTQRFKPNDAVRAAERIRHGWQNQRILIHAGSLGGLHLVQEIAYAFAAGLRMDPTLRLLVISQSDSRQLQSALAALGINRQHWKIESHIPEDMPQALSCGDLGLALIKPSFSKIASWPTKIGEYLAMGMPVLGTRHIGDTEEFLVRHGVGAIVPQLSPAGCAVGMARLLNLVNQTPTIKQHCRTIAITHLEVAQTGRERYLDIYRHAGSHQGYAPEDSE